jgi:hypothetical protein
MAVNMSVKPAWRTLEEPARGCKLRTTARSNCLRSCCGSPHLGRAVSTSRRGRECSGAKERRLRSATGQDVIRRRNRSFPELNRSGCNPKKESEFSGVFRFSISLRSLPLCHVAPRARKTHLLCLSTRRRSIARTRGGYRYVNLLVAHVGRPHARVLVWARPTLLRGVAST